MSAEEDKDGKLVCESIQEFDEIPKKVWVKFPTMEDYRSRARELLSAISDSDGRDSVVIYIENPRSMKQLPPNQSVCADRVLLERLEKLFGEENVKVM